MDDYLIPVCPSSQHKKRKLHEDSVIDNVASPELTAGVGLGRQFLTIPRSDSVFQTEDWRTPDSALFLPVEEDLLVNIRKMEQISCSDGNYFVADSSGNYSKTVAGKVIHLWRYDKTQRKLYISRSFLFTRVQEYLTVQRFLQHI